MKVVKWNVLCFEYVWKKYVFMLEVLVDGNVWKMFLDNWLSGGVSGLLIVIEVFGEIWYFCIVFLDMVDGKDLVVIEW